jgi:hypothetical protein
VQPVKESNSGMNSRLPTHHSTGLREKSRGSVSFSLGVRSQEIHPSEMCREETVTIRDFYIKLPSAYTPELKKDKRVKTYAHIYESYFGAGRSVYQGAVA